MRTGYQLGDWVRLQGYRLDVSDARPGGNVRLTLFWEALQPADGLYQVFNHLYEGRMWGQQDGTPACGYRPTVLWEPGQVVRDDYVIPLDADTPRGNLPLQVGMYDLATGDRLPVRELDGKLIGDAVPLAVVRVR